MTGISSPPSRRQSPIRRTRPSYSCEECRRRRVKCNQVHPTCGNCLKADITCVYQTPLPKRKEPSCSEQDSRSLRRKVLRAPTHPKGGYLSMQSGGRCRFVENTFWASVDPEGLDTDSFIFELPLVPVETESGTLEEDLINSQASFAPYFKHFNGPLGSTFSSSPSQNSSYIRSDCQSLQGCLNSLPSQAVCDQLYRNFHAYVHPLLPLIHTPTFDDQYRRFWQWFLLWDGIQVPAGVLAETPSFLPLLFAVLFTGSVAGQDLPFGSDASTEAQTLQRTLCCTTSRVLAMVGFPHNPAIPALQAFLMLQTFLFKEEESLSSCSFVAVAIRIAQAMGLHHEPSDFGLGPVQCEERRRIWRYIMHLDVVTSCVSGLPMTLPPAMCFTKPLQELRDEFIGTSKSSKDSENPDCINPAYVLTNARYEAAACLREILGRHISSQTYETEEFDELKELVSSLKERIEERIQAISNLISSGSLPLDTKYDPTESAYSSYREAFLGWAASLLRLQVYRAYCLLYLPLLQDHEKWAAYRSEAIPYYQTYLRLFSDIIDTSSYMPFHWLYPGMYQPLNQTTVLLVDLLRRPTSSEAMASRLALDPIFARLGLNGRNFGRNSAENHYSPRRTSNAARITWSRLEALRKRVWKGLGIDASVSWGSSHTNISESYGFSSSIASEAINMSRTDSQPRSENLFMSTAEFDLNIAERPFSEPPLSTFMEPKSFDAESQTMDMGMAAGFDSFQFTSNDIECILGDQDFMMWQVFGASDATAPGKGFGTMDLGITV